uniref:L-ascorbate peroxidase n=1 Tax=Leersia perrieri TaxID=77586 RepID=A0A0D9W550_9ORYZ
MAAERLAVLRAAAPAISSQHGRRAARPSSAFLPAAPLPRAASLRAASSRLLPQSASAAAGSGRWVRCMAATAAATASDAAELKAAREDVRELLKTTFCHPILVRLGWHDAGTYDKNIKEWPQRGGANGSLRFEVELKHGANAGLVNALKLVQPIKDKYPNISYADLFQLASATAIEEAGGPKIPMTYGRVDVTGPEQCPPEGKLPGIKRFFNRKYCTGISFNPLKPMLANLQLSFPVVCSDAGPTEPADHLRKVFYRMGLDDKDIVVLSGAHTLGRSRPDRSGWGKPETKYTKNGPGAPGGQSWTAEWLKFDNSYFKEIKEKRDQDLLVLPTDAALFEDTAFKVYAEKYAEDQEAFFKDYAKSHAKLSNLGAKFSPPEGFTLDG